MEIKFIEETSEVLVEKKLEQIRNEILEKIEEIFKVKIFDRRKRINLDDFRSDSSREEFAGFALLITGESLVHALSDKLKLRFIEIGTICKSVVCCRVTPLQKACVVQLVMESEKKITLAIGDGANDVSMIQSERIDHEKRHERHFIFFSSFQKRTLASESADKKVDKPF